MYLKLQFLFNGNHTNSRSLRNINASDSSGYSPIATGSASCHCMSNKPSYISPIRVGRMGLLVPSSMYCPWCLLLDLHICKYKTAS